MNIRLKKLLAIVCGFVVGGVMILLGVWQTARYNESMVDVAAERLKQPPVTLVQHRHPDGTFDDIYGRRAHVTGAFIDQPPLWVGTTWPMRYVRAFRTTDGHVLPIVLGQADKVTDVQLTPGEKLDLTGVFTSSDTAVDEPVAPGAPSGSLPSLRLQTLAQRWPQPVLAGYITLNTDAAARYGLKPAQPILPEPQGSGMHRGYALQWWVFAVAAIVFGFVVARGIKPSRPLDAS